MIVSGIVWVAIKVGILVAVVVSTATPGRLRVGLTAFAVSAAGAALIPFGATVGAAAIISVAATLPQVMLTLLRGGGLGLSNGAVALGVGGEMSWALYGLARGDSALFWCSAFAAVLNAVLLSAAVTQPGAILRHSRRQARIALYLDAVIVRHITHATAVLATGVESRLPAFAAGIRNRHSRLQDRLELAGSLA